jgi:hypothetical protein
MDDPLEAILDRLTRADEHLQAIKRELIRYYESDPCTLAGEFDPDDHGGEWGGETAPLQVRLNTLIGEFLHRRVAAQHALLSRSSRLAACIEQQRRCQGRSKSHPLLPVEKSPPFPLS